MLQNRQDFSVVLINASSFPGKFKSCVCTLLSNKCAVMQLENCNSCAVFTPSDIYNISVDPSNIEVPLGARLSFVLSFSTPPIRPEYMFYPLYHTPLQQAMFIESRSDVELSYNRASPSLTGTYVACRSGSLIVDGPTPSASSLPAQCGRKISLNVTSKHITSLVPRLFP